MPAAKLCSSGTHNAMKSEEGSDSLDTFIRQAIGKEPLLPFSRTADNPVQWIQLLHALDQPDLPGWPLMTPLKVQMQKCEKCSREFCSPINYRRHIRVHRRSLNVDKESHKNRDLLAAFWDKLSLEQAKDVVSFDDVMLKEIPGSSLARALASSLRKPGVWTLPQAYVKAGSTLLDIIQAKSSRLPISSQELFSILDDASERTFLCAGTTETVQKYIFDGETAKNSLELKNLVASTSFLFEQQLVKAWVADKDAEALRCQKLLVEEEEAAQKRQALLLERKKQKKLRQKEQKVKEQFYGSNENLNVDVEAVDGPTSTEASGPSSPSDCNSNSPDVPINLDSGLESTQPQSKEPEEEIGAHSNISSEHINLGDAQTIEPANGYRAIVTNRCHVSKSQRGSRYGFHVSPHLQTFKPETLHKTGPSKDRSLLNGSKVWTKKLKVDSYRESLKPPSLQGENGHQIEENKCEVIIGSISVALKNSVPHHQDSRPDEAQDVSSTEHAMLKKKNASEKLIKANSSQSGSSRGASKLWRPVIHGEVRSVTPFDRGNEDSAQSQSTDSDGIDNRKHYHVVPDENAQGGCLPFSSIAAKEFLAQRWKEAISSDHVKLVLSAGPQPPGCSDVQQDSSTVYNVPELHECINNQFGRNVQGKFSKKQEKSLKVKYRPKQKAVG
ncbi:uncharacterized protein LOC105160463 isoform X1 [Sesamum indicum]|uniref:Uncharacterized protein LOC105160463 isoform X1 n=2 Tax=Sesamum indicum TaxID=4182 RepID=A0A6I9T2C1_SESIN|nr:uncharacterized protein LOC105160463 isoform X1 [Sesamum indicum]XP_020548920.1 uncharacterized protein LOC105160463 isoform X1 [Sesamum indicum]